MKSGMKLMTLVAGMVLTGSMMFVSLCGADPGQSPERSFALGNDRYEKGEYAEAITEYEKALAEGYKSGPLYYNLGNAYYKSGQIGEAILSYERAKSIMPRDADLNANYRFARAMVKGRVVSSNGIWAFSPIRDYSENFTLNEITLVSAGLYIFALILIFLAITSPGIRVYVLVVLGLSVGASALNGVILWDKVQDVNKGAVVIEPRAAVLYGPFDTATKFFNLNEGMVVSVLKEKEGWYKIRRADGKVGWVRDEEIEKI